MQFLDNTSCKAFATQELVLRSEVAVRNIFQMTELLQCRNLWTCLLDLQQGTRAINRLLLQRTDQRQRKNAKYDRENRPAAFLENSPVDTEIPGLLRLRQFVRLRQFWISMLQNRGNRLIQLDFPILRHIISCKSPYPCRGRWPLPRRDTGRSGPHCLERRQYPWAVKLGQAVFLPEFCRARSEFRRWLRC